MANNPLPFREVSRKLRAAGFVEIGRRGSHVKFGNQTETGYRTAIVPFHRDVAAGTIRSILRQAGLTQSAFDSL